jgi:2',3'-cyclic-nucleotide 2'-phosphodiesterase (5'-nucleotidase family)
MRRFSFIFYLLLFLISCKTQLVVREINAGNVTIDSSIGAVDAGLDAMIKPYRDSIEHDMSKLVAVTSTAMVKGKPESKLTNLISDILLESGSEYCKKNRPDVKPDAAYVNYGGLRAPLPQGNVTVERVFELMPFENELVLLKVSGETLLQMAEKIAARGGEGLAGLKLGIKNDRVSSLTLAGNSIDKNAVYWLVTNDYVANGGDQMSMFLNQLERIDTRLKLRDLIILKLGERYRKYGVIDVKEDGRIYHEQ